MFTDLSLTIIFHYLPNLELNEVHEEGFREVFKSICCSQVRDQTPLLKQDTECIKSKHLQPHFVLFTNRKKKLNRKKTKTHCSATVTKSNPPFKWKVTCLPLYPDPVQTMYCFIGHFSFSHKVTWKFFHYFFRKQTNHPMNEQKGEISEKASTSNLSTCEIKLEEAGSLLC